MEIPLIFLYVVLVFSVVCHECAHAIVAYKLGDPTAKDAGRITLNPISHIDPIMTIFLPLIFILSGLPPLGGPRPVPINPRNFRNPIRGMMWVAIAGPATNMILCIIFFMLTIGAKWLLIRGVNISVDVIFVLYNSSFINFILTAFNLMPIPPLDGSRILRAILPYSYIPYIDRIERIGIGVIILLLVCGVLDRILDMFEYVFDFVTKSLLY